MAWAKVRVLAIQGLRPPCGEPLHAPPTCAGIALRLDCGTNARRAETRRAVAPSRPRAPPTRPLLAATLSRPLRALLRARPNGLRCDTLRLHSRARAPLAYPPIGDLRARSSCLHSPPGLAARPPSALRAPRSPLLYTEDAKHKSSIRAALCAFVAVRALAAPHTRNSPTTTLGHLHGVRIFSLSLSLTLTITHVAAKAASPPKA